MATRVLVINFTEEILQIFRDLLEDEGYEVFIYSFAPQELVEVKCVKPDLIVLDLIFGGEKLGWQLLQKLKMDRATARIPVVVWTAATLAVREIEGHLAAQDVILVPKPFDIGVLLLSLKQALAMEKRTAATMDADAADEPDPHDDKQLKRRT